MPSGGVHSITEIRALLRRLLRAIRANWPNTEILLRADSHYCGPEVLDWCRANGVDFIFGVAPTSTLRRHVERLEASTMARYVAAPHAGKARRYTEFYDGAASWSRVERIIARVEAGADGTDTRFIVTNLPTRNARALYEEVYCRRGAAENHIKSWKTHLAADRTSCTKATANQFRLFLHAGAYWLMWSVRSLMPKRSMWRVAQFIPFATAWLDESHFAPIPTAIYGVSLLMPAVAFSFLQAVIIRAQGRDSELRKALGADWKGKVSIVAYMLAIVLAFVDPRLPLAVYVLIALLWLVPDRRIEKWARHES